MSDLFQSAIIVPDTESVARIIHEKHVRGGIISPAAFTLRDRTPPENYMSVHRIDMVPLTYDMAVRVISRNLYGYAKILVEAVHKCNTQNAYTKVVAYPSDGNKAHAGIHVVIDGVIAVGKGEAERDEFLEVTSRLALCATLQALTKRN